MKKSEILQWSVFAGVVMTVFMTVLLTGIFDRINPTGGDSEVVTKVLAWSPYVMAVINGLCAFFMVKTVLKRRAQHQGESTVKALGKTEQS